MSKGNYPRTEMFGHGLFLVLNRGYVPKNTKLERLVGFPLFYEDSNKIYEILFDEDSGLYMVNLSVDIEPVHPKHVRKFVDDRILDSPYMKSMILSTGPQKPETERKFEEVKKKVGLIEEMRSEKRLPVNVQEFICENVLSNTVNKYSIILEERGGK